MNTSFKLRRRFFSLGLVTIIVMFIFMIFSSVLMAVGSPPPIITLQATLSNDTGLLEGKKRVTVRLYEGEDRTGWEEIHKGSVFVNGSCALRLGTITPFSVEDFNIATPNFRMIVDGEEIVVTLNAQPYALRSVTTERVPPILDVSELTVSENFYVGNAEHNANLMVWGDMTVTGNLVVSQDVLVISNNRVGIGTANPVYMLEVVGSVNVKELYIDGQPFVSAEGYENLDTISGLEKNDGSIIVASDDTWISTSDYKARDFLGLGESNNPTFNNLSVSYLGVDVTVPNGVFEVRSTDNYLEIPEKTTSLIVTNNRVGIGTTVPSASLQVSGNSPLIVGTASTPNALVVSSNGNVGIGRMPSDNYSLHILGDVMVEGHLTTQLGVKADDDWIVELDNGFIYSTSNVGVGLTNPNADLHVRTSYIAEDFDVVVTRNRVGIGALVPTAQLHVREQDASESLLFLVDKDDDSPWLVIDDEGNMGLGLVNPSSILQIEENNILSLVVSGNRVGIGTSNISSLFDIYTSQPSLSYPYFKAYNDIGVSFVITGSGNVGIGTANPVSLLHIVAPDGTDAFMVTGDAIGIGTSSPDGLLDIYTSLLVNDFYLRIKDDDSIKFLVTGDGKVGVSNDSPKGEFHVLEDSFVVTGNNVGVGTISPKGSFEVMSTDNVSGVRGHTMVITDNRVVIGGVNGNESYIMTIKGNVIVEGILQHDAGGDDGWDTDWLYSGENMYSGKKFVGIGTSVPVAPFHIKTKSIESGNTENTLIVENNQVGVGVLDPQASLHIKSAYNLLRVDSGSDDYRLFVNTDGDIGIGTSEPNYDLDVNGKVHVGDALYIDGNEVTMFKLKALTDSFIVGSGNAWVTRNPEEARSSLGVGVEDSVYLNRLGINTDVINGELHVKSTDNVLAQKFDTLIVTNNRVGIGSTEPEAQFDILGKDSGEIFRVKSSTGTNDGFMSINNRGYVGIGTRVPSGNLHVKSVDYLGTLRDSFVVTRNRIGVGTIYPDAAIDVIYDTAEKGEGVSYFPGLRLFNRNPADPVVEGHEISLVMSSGAEVGGGDVTDLRLSAIRQEKEGAVVSSDFVISVRPSGVGSSYIEHLRLKNNGYLGLGTAMPSGNLHVYTTNTDMDLVVSDTGVGVGTIYPSANFQVVTSVTNNMFAINEMGIAVGTLAPSGNFHVETGGGETSLVVTANGVGLGLTNPKGLLHVSSLGGDTLVVSRNGVGFGTITPNGLLHVYSATGVGDSHDTLVVTNNIVSIRSTNPPKDVDYALYVSGNTKIKGALYVDSFRNFGDEYEGINIEEPEGPLHVISTDNYVVPAVGGDSLIVTRNRVGIGTSQPELVARLTVASGLPIIVRGDTYAAYTEPVLASMAEYLTTADIAQDDNSNPTHWSGIGSYADGGLWLRANDYTFWTYDSDNTRQNVFHLGRDMVGIGTTQPDSGLHIVTANGTVFKAEGLAASNILVMKSDGKVGIATANPEFKLSLDNDGGIIAKGTHGSGDDLTSAGAGTKLIWYPKKSAFRAGNVAGTEWDDDNIGDYSVAFGKGVQASGISSVAFGVTTNAQAYGSVVMGRYNLVSGTTDSWVAGDSLFVVGNGADNANRDNAFTILKNGKAGVGTANPEFKLSIDNDGGIIAKGTYGSGDDLISTGAGARMIWYPKKSAFRAGYIDGGQWNNDTVGGYSVAMGRNTLASGNAAIAFGFGSIASGDYSTAIGSGLAEGAYSIAMGIAATANAEGSVAIGKEVKTIGKYAQAMGMNTLAKAYGSMVVGRYNEVSGNAESWTGSDPLFVIGNGTDVAPNNAFTVMQDGKVGVSTANPRYDFEVAGVFNATDVLINGKELVESTPGLLSLATLTSENYNFIVGYEDTWTTMNGWVARDALGLADSPTFNRVGINIEQTDIKGLLHIKTDTDDTFVVTNNRVGVGTTEPAEKLDVVGGVKATLGAEGFVFTGLSGDDENRVSMGLGRSDVEASLGVVAIDDDYILGSRVGDFVIKTEDNSKTIYVNSGAVTSLVVKTEGIGVGTTAINSKLAINGNAAVGSGYSDQQAPENGLIVQGDVGIGTSTPIGVLDVISDGENTFVVTDNMVGIGIGTPNAVLDIKNNSTDIEVGLNLGHKYQDTVREWQVSVAGYSGTSERGKFPLVVSRNMPSVTGEIGDFVVSGEKDFVIENSGKVGIATANPNAMLAIEALSGYGILMTGTMPTHDFVVSSDGKVGIGTLLPSSNLHILSDGISPLTVGTVITPSALVVTAEGFVGIGTANPNEALMVDGKVRIKDELVFDWDGSHPNAADHGIDSKNSADESVGSLRFNSFDDVLVRLDTNANYDESYFMVTHNAGARDDGVLFYVKTPSGDMYVSGNVGIGTTIPVYALGVAGTINATKGILIDGNPVLATTPKLAMLGSLTTENNNIIVADGDNWSTRNGWLARDALGLADSPTFNRVGINIEQTDIKGLLHIKTDTDDTFVVTNNMVGIGTTLPEAKLDVVGTLKINGTENADRSAGIEITSTKDADLDRWRSRIFFKERKTANEGLKYGYSIIANGNYDGGAEDLLNYPYNTFGISAHQNDEMGNIAFSIKRSNSYVGINTATPNSNLAVNGDMAIGANYASMSNAAGTNGLVVEGSVGIGITQPEASLHVTGNSNIVFRVQGNGVDSSTRNFVVSANGMVGIGLTDPVGTLTVVGSEGYFGDDHIAPTSAGSIVLRANDDRVAGDSAGTKVYENLGSAMVFQGDVYPEFLLADRTYTVSAIKSIYDSEDTGKALEGSHALAFYTFSGGVDGSNDLTGTISEKMRVTSTGDIGIGTTKPEGIFHIVNGGNDLFNIGYNNWVGIGTAEPKESLDINGAIKISEAASDGSASGEAGVLYFDSSERAFFGVVETGEAAVPLNAVWTPTNNADGVSYGAYYNKNVGIGTSEPLAKLQVAIGTDELIAVTKNVNFNNNVSVVAIGTTAPANTGDEAYKLYVNGSAYFDATITINGMVDAQGFLQDGDLINAGSIEGYDLAEIMKRANYRVSGGGDLAWGVVDNRLSFTESLYVNPSGGSGATARKIAITADSIDGVVAGDVLYVTVSDDDWNTGAETFTLLRSNDLISTVNTVVVGVRGQTGDNNLYLADGRVINYGHIWQDDGKRSFEGPIGVGNQVSTVLDGNESFVVSGNMKLVSGADTTNTYLKFDDIGKIENVYAIALDGSNATDGTDPTRQGIVAEGETGADTKSVKINSLDNVIINLDSKAEDTDGSYFKVLNGSIIGDYQGELIEGTIASAGWYRIAAATQMGSQYVGNAEFTIRDVTAKSSATFRVGFGAKANGISFTLLNHSYNGALAAINFTKARLVIRHNEAPAYLEVYVSRASAVECSIKDNSLGDGWAPVEWTPASNPVDPYAGYEYDLTPLFMVGNLESKFVVSRNGVVGMGDKGINAHASLTVSATGNTLGGFAADFRNSGSVAGAGGVLFGQGSDYAYKLHTESTASELGALVWSYVQNDGTVVSDNRLTMNTYGVGINKLASTYALEVNGDIECVQVHANSDLRLKKEINSIDNALEKVLQMRGVFYEWRRDEFEARNFPAGRSVGMIAQELESIVPELVATGGDGYKSISYANLVAVLVEAIKEQQQQIALQDEKIDMIIKENKALRKDVEEIKRLLK